VGFAEVEVDSPLIEDLPVRYGVRSVPTLMAFVRGEVVEGSRVEEVKRLEDEAWVRKWIEREAGRAREKGKGGKWLDGWFGR